MTKKELSCYSSLQLVAFLSAAILTGCASPPGDGVVTSDSASTTPATAVETAESGLPTDEQWAKLRECESGGRYDISNPNGKYHGAYQFNQDTWNNTAKNAGRSDLVGVKPSVASSKDQDSLAVALFQERGSQPWPKCGTFLK